jgi:hypothetical protein
MTRVPETLRMDQATAFSFGVPRVLRGISLVAV